jgi:hypothetical protein
MCQEPILLVPASLGGLASDLGALLWRHGCRTSGTAFQATFTAQGNSGLVFGGIFVGAVLDPTGEDIAYQLAELYGIARARESLVCHPDSMPLVRARRYTALDFKLYHYPAIAQPGVPDGACDRRHRHLGRRAVGRA